jgi:hypothetical protein
MQKSLAQLQTDWITHGNIAKLKAKLSGEIDGQAREKLEFLIHEQRKLLSDHVRL